MDITLEQLQNSKIYVKNNISYMQPRSIIDPILELWDKTSFSGDYRVAIQNEVVNQNISGEENIAYPRFLIEAKKEEVIFEYDIKYQNTFGLLVAMDQQSPVIKVYSGMNVSACTNLCIFNADHLFQQNLMDPLDNVFSAVRGFVMGELTKIDEYREIHKRLVGTLLTQEELNENLGRLLRLGFYSKLGTSPVVGGAKLLSDKRSKYYADGESSLYNLYNAITQCITDSPDILYKPDKTMALTRLLLN